MEIWCTRPNCSNPHNSFPDLDDKSVLKTVQQRFCSNCGMPLLLDGRYLPIKLLGRGGFGAAYLAYDRRTPAKHVCVVKQLLPQSELSNEQLAIAHDLFDREAEVLEKLGSQHPQIPMLLANFPLSVSDSQTGGTKQFFYLVQEYVEGKTLEEVLKEKGKFSEEDVVAMLESVLQILDFVHQNNAIHRDIKPSNIIQRANGQYFLLDFGTVKQVAQGASTSASSTGVFTAGFAPPEQISGQQVYPSTDLYALAITAVVLLTGKLNPLDCFDSYNNRWDWRKQSSPVSDQTVAVLQKMMETVPSQRYETAHDALQALRRNESTSSIPPTRVDSGFNPQSQGSNPVPPTIASPAAYQGGSPVSEPPMTGNASASQPPINPQPYSQPPVSQPPVQQPYSQPPVSQPPINQQPYSQPPVSQPPVNQQPYSQQPVGQSPVNQQPYSQQPYSQPPVSQPPASQSPYPAPTAVQPVASYNQPYRAQTQPSKRGWGKPAVIAGAIALLGLGGWGIYSLLTGSESSATEQLSYGDRLLVADDGTTAKTKAVEDFGDKKFADASDGFTDSLDEKPNDPEALIYLNNSIIGEDKSHAIAISIPIESEDEGTKNAAKELLRGVAHAQDNINRSGGIDGTPLKVLIVTESNEPESTAKVAKKLVKNKEVLGVIGHFGSGATLAAAEIYQKEGLPMISATSTSTDLSGFGNYIFRTVPSDKFTGEALARYTLEKLKKKKAAVFYNQDSGYSKSLQNAFRVSLLSNGGEVVKEFDLNREGFNARKDVRLAQDQGAEVIVLLPNSATLPQTFKVIRANRQELPMLAGDSPYRSTTLDEGAADAEGMVLAVPWHILADPAATFPKEARKLWGGDVSWRTAMAYDASQSLIYAIEDVVQSDDTPTREEVRDALSETTFSPPGSSGTVEFFASGDRKRPTQLVKIVPGNHPSGFVFVPTK